MMKDIVVNMIKIYGLTDRDWMSFKITSKRSITYHHIIKTEDGGKTTIRNGALLTKKAHNLLHCIEYNDLAIYKEINALFQIINKNKCGKEELEQIRFLILKYLDAKEPIPKDIERSYTKKMLLECSNENKFKIYV